uniref:Transcription elongation factor, mitochondrial-like n=1 Tax=Saccoglossus kowalevskii TaxID=10224 RepID=A0ABM0M401_SACKO|nr:PREDICTED: transcription elongation factor, mitochondrial-like [Saccoglossus kowalevskii]
MFCVCALRSVRTKIRLHQCLATRYRQCSTAKESCEDTEHPTITEDDDVTQTKELKIRRNKAQKILTNLYTENERQLLLDRFNNADEAELCNIKYLRVRTAKEIIEHREKHGLFKDIHSLVGICGIGEKMMQFYCVDIMDKIAGNQSATQKKSNIKTSNKMNFFAMKPNLSEERLQSLQSIVSIDIAFKSIAWIHMERDMKVCDWKHQQLDVKPSRHDPIAYVENVSQS